MPVNIPKDLPARRLLESENVFVMTAPRARHQDIRPLHIAILNLMPTKIETETQLLRLLGNSPLQVEITLLHMESHASKNTSAEHLATFYDVFQNIKTRKFDGLVITGAPVENLPFESVDYWPELVAILEWSKTNVFSTFHICWGAQAALYYHYKVPKYTLTDKQFGVFEHRILLRQEPIVRGFDDIFPAPHSRHTETRKTDLQAVSDLRLVAESDAAGVLLLVSRDQRQIFVTGHLEYDQNSLKKEYDRDIGRGLKIALPTGYFPNDDPAAPPPNTWRSHANLLYTNWLNYYVYQRTPYDLNDIPNATRPVDDYVI